MNKVLCLLVVFACLSLVPSSNAALCSLLLSNAACLNNVCTLNSAILTTLCGATGVLEIALNMAATVNFQSTTTITLAGINVSSSAQVNVNFASAVTLTNDLIVSGNAVVGVAQGAVVTVGGQLQAAAGTTVRVLAGAVLSVSGAVTIQAAATIEVAGNFSAAAAANVYGNLKLAGTYVVDSSAQTAWFVVRSASRIVVVGSVSAGATASITGNGGIDANVNVEGNVTIAAGNSPGYVWVNGDLDMSSSTTLEIEVDSGLSYDRIGIRGAFKRDGILYANFDGGYVPNNGQEFTFATHSSSEGTFNLAHGDFDKTFDEVHPRYDTLATSFVYGSASAITLPFIMIAICIFAIVF